MEFDIQSTENLSLLLNILRNYGPDNMTGEQEDFLNLLADAIEDCAGETTLHLNI